MRVTLQADSGRAPHVPVGRSLASVRPSGPRIAASSRCCASPSRRTSWPAACTTSCSPTSIPTRRATTSRSTPCTRTSRLGRGPAVPDGLPCREHRGGGAARAGSPRRSRPHEYYLPILDVVGGGAGQHDGLGYMEVWDPQADRRRRDGAPAAARAGRPDDPRRRRVAARAPPRRDRRPARAAPRAPGRAGARLGVGGPRTRCRRTVPGGCTCASPSPVSLGAGTDFALTASATAAGSYEAFPIRKGTGFGFDPRTYFDRRLRAVQRRRRLDRLGPVGRP